MARSSLLRSIAVCFAVSSSAFAGEAPLSPGQLAFNGGLGLGRSPLPLYAGLDVSVHRDVTLGGDVFVSTGAGGIAAMGRGDYHWNRLLGIPRQGDFYLGLGLVLGDWGLYPRLQLGGRWFFNDRVGLNLELGGATKEVGGLFGVTVKLGN